MRLVLGAFAPGWQVTYFLAGEYPPISGGVADHTALIASELTQAGEEVHVWTGGNEGTTREGRLWVHRMGRDYGVRGLLALNAAWDHLPPPDRVIVQWTPHSYGFRGVNIAVPIWLWVRARWKRDRIEPIIHEPFVSFKKGRWKQNAGAVLQRAMAGILLGSAARVRVTIPAWRSRLRPWTFGRDCKLDWLPVPSNIPESPDVREVLRLRAQLAPQGELLIGHFGTFRPDTAAILGPAIVSLLRLSAVRILLCGRNSDRFAAEFLRQNRDAGKRISATGEAPAEELSTLLSACDVLLQPYDDGISTRRGSAMAALALGIPIVSNMGHLSEPEWVDSGAVQLAPGTEPDEIAEAVLDLARDRFRRSTMSARARALYQERFAVRHSVQALLNTQPSGDLKSKAMLA